MVQVLLFLLKIIGILLLVLLGILLVLLLLVLFVPVRYRVSGEWQETRFVAAQVTWLLHGVSVRGGYEMGGEGLRLRLKVLGFTIWKNEESGGDEEDGAEVELAAAAEAGAAGEASGGANATEAVKAGVASGSAAAAEDAKAGEASGGANAAEAVKADVASGSAAAAEDAKASGASETGSADDDQEAEAGSASPPKKPPLPKRLAEKIKRIFCKLAFSFRSICDKLKKVRRLAKKAQEWVMDEKNQASLRLLWRQAKRLIAHLWPRKGAGTITFGFDDPYTTGQVLAAASMLYPFYYKQLTLCPIFEGGTVFEAQGSFRGRIRVVSLLWIGLGVLRDKHTRKMIFRLLRGGRA